jgi:hypothetical protein
VDADGPIPREDRGGAVADVIAPSTDAPPAFVAPPESLCVGSVDSRESVDSPLDADDLVTERSAGFGRAPPAEEGMLGGRGRVSGCRWIPLLVECVDSADEDVVESVPLDPAEPVLSAKAIVGIEASAAPIPNATASAPIRPT